MEALRIEYLSKDFDGIRAVHNVTVSMEIGERLTLIGPNRAGKTTFI